MIDNLENWLQEQGGPAIQLRLCALRDSKKSKEDSAKAYAKAVSALLKIEEVYYVLNYMDGFNTPDRDDKTFEHLIHYYKDTCIENFFPLITDMGFKAGIPIFDKKMAFVAKIFKYLFANANDNVKCYNSTLMLHRFFFISGYLIPEVIESLENRLNAIHKIAKERIFDIYQDNGKLPKKPKQWVNVGVIKEQMNPFNNIVEKPLPTIYDIWSLAYYQHTCDDADKLKKINDLVKYILDPEFQKLREGYGLIWNKDRRIYHACGWSPTLPLYEIEGRPVQSVVYPIIDYLEFMSNFKIAQKSKWFKDCLCHFEQFKTERGTYIFPMDWKYLHKKYIDKVFLSESNMVLKRNERELLKRELVSTMKMVEIYKKIKEI